jgi:hypothetical protein
MDAHGDVTPLWYMIAGISVEAAAHAGLFCDHVPPALLSILSTCKRQGVLCTKETTNFFKRVRRCLAVHMAILLLTAARLAVQAECSLVLQGRKSLRNRPSIYDAAKAMRDELL